MEDLDARVRAWAGEQGCEFVAGAPATVRWQRDASCYQIHIHDSTRARLILELSYGDAVIDAGRVLARVYREERTLRVAELETQLTYAKSYLDSLPPSAASWRTVAARG